MPVLGVDHERSARPGPGDLAIERRHDLRTTGHAQPAGRIREVVLDVDDDDRGLGIVANRAVGLLGAISVVHLRRLPHLGLVREHAHSPKKNRLNGRRRSSGNVSPIRSEPRLTSSTTRLTSAASASWTSVGGLTIVLTARRLAVAPTITR